LSPGAVVFNSALLKEIIVTGSSFLSKYERVSPVLSLFFSKRTRFVHVLLFCWLVISVMQGMSGQGMVAHLLTQL
jgi:hypothetical protein